MQDISHVSLLEETVLMLQAEGGNEAVSSFRMKRHTLRMCRMNLIGFAAEVDRKVTVFVGGDQFFGFEHRFAVQLREGITDDDVFIPSGGIFPVIEVDDGCVISLIQHHAGKGVGHPGNPFKCRDEAVCNLFRIQEAGPEGYFKYRLFDGIEGNIRVKYLFQHMMKHFRQLDEILCGLLQTLPDIVVF